MRRILIAFGLLMALSATAAQSQRRDAIFILGDDETGGGSYFEPATTYYSGRMRRDVDLLVTGARSLQAVRQWLATAHHEDDPPWGRIILVAHGSPWIGLDVPLYGDGTPADLSILERAIERGEFPPLPDAMVDGTTRLVIESCGVGRRSDLLELYARLLGGPDAQRSSVSASKNWIEFGHGLDGDGRMKAWRAERQFAALVLPHAKLDTAQVEDARQSLSRQLGEADRQVPGRARTWRMDPVQVELRIAQPAACRSDRAIRRLKARAAMADRLRDYGLHSRDLAWHVEHGVSHCSLVGQGTLAVLGEGRLAGELVR